MAGQRPRIVDTGPLVALPNRTDTHHAHCLEFFSTYAGSPLVPSTVMVEVCWLLESQPPVEAAFPDAVASGTFDLIAVTTADTARMDELVRQYADFPLGAVDASVVAVAERLDVAEVVTLDRHFSVIRPRHITAFTLLPTLQRPRVTNCWRGELVLASGPNAALLRYLIANSEWVVSKRQILQHAWHYEFHGDGSIVDVLRLLPA